MRPVTSREGEGVSLPAAIRETRSVHGWSQVRLANELGTSERTVKRWEAGQAVPSSEFRQRLIILGVAAELFERAETAEEVERRLRILEGEIAKVRALLARS